MDCAYVSSVVQGVDFRMRKILYLFNAADWESRIAVADAAQDMGLEIVIGLINPKGVMPESPYKISALEQTGSNLNPISTLRLIRDMRVLIQQEQPDVVHTVTLKYGFMVGLAAARFKAMRKIHTLAGLGYVFRGQGLRPLLLRLAIAPLLKHALKRPNTLLIFQNSDDQALMIDAGYVAAADTTLIRGSGIVLEKFEGFEDRRDPDTPLVLMPTRLVHDKGVAVFIEAAKILAEHGVHAQFKIAGGVSKDNPSGISETEMTAMLKGSPVEWLGRVENMPELLSQASLVVFPSYYGEGIPRVLLEACAAGRAIVTTDHPGCREAIVDGEGGLLVPIQDADATAAAIKTLLDDPQRRKDMEACNYKRARTEFDIKAIALQTAALY